MRAPLLAVGRMKARRGIRTQQLVNYILYEYQ